LNIRHCKNFDNSVHANRGVAVLLILFIYVVMLLAGTWVVAAQRPLWSDELYTYYIATLPSLSDVWSALLTGHEQLPLGFYAIERFFLGTLGANNVALRLPALLGCLVMSLALFGFVSRRLSPAFGLLAAVFPMITSAYSYARDARPYGLELGLATLALLCWQRTTESNNRLPALIGLWLSLLVAISCHYYGVLLVLPLAFGELFRTMTRRRLDIGIWSCFAGSILPLFVMLPLILSAAKLVGDFWAEPAWQNVAGFYQNLMTLKGTALPLVAVVTLGVVAARCWRPVPAENAAFPAHEQVAILGFIALPLVGVALAKLITHSFTDRYVLASVVGLSIVFAQAMHKILSGEQRIAAMLALFLISWFGLLEVHEARQAKQLQQDLEASTTLLQSADEKGLPIVLAEIHTFVELSHYAPPDIARHFVYLADPSAARRFLGFGSLDSGMLELVGPWFRMHVVPFEQFVNSKSRFLLYGREELDSNWVIRALKERRFRIEFQTNIEKKYLFTVTPPDQ
jgi:hypothetical protein